MLHSCMSAAPVLLLDSPSLVYRAYFALPNSIRSPAGKAINAVVARALAPAAAQVKPQLPAGTDVLDHVRVKDLHA